MNSFVNVMANDVWSEADIKRRVAAMIESELFDVETAEAAGDASRADMARLQAALDYEAAVRRLAMPEVTEPETVITYDDEGNATEVPNPAIEQDATEREAAQAIVDNVTEETLELVALRNPVEEVDEGELLNEGIE